MAEVFKAHYHLFTFTRDERGKLPDFEIRLVGYRSRHENTSADREYEQPKADDCKRGS